MSSLEHDRRAGIADRDLSPLAMFAAKTVIVASVVTTSIIVATSS